LFLDTGHDLHANILHFALRLQQFDGDVVEGDVRFVAGDVGEVPEGVAELAVGHDDAGFGFALDGVDNVGGTEGDVHIWHVVLVEKRGVMRGDAYAENADVIIFQDEMMVGLPGNRNGGGGLSGE
jgi:hypothetical protein